MHTPSITQRRFSLVLVFRCGMFFSSILRDFVRCFGPCILPDNWQSVPYTCLTLEILTHETDRFFHRILTKYPSSFSVLYYIWQILKEGDTDASQGYLVRFLKTSAKEK